MLRVNFRRIDFVHRKKIVIFQSIYKNTFIQLKKGMRTWRMQSSFHDRSCLKRVDCKWNPNDVLTTCKANCEVLVSGYASYACADVACSNGTRTLKGKKLWRPEAADSVLSLRLGNWRIDRILHFYHVFVHFASYEYKSLLPKFFSRKVEQ